jgi:uncharacterized membrane protein YeaQ/YmgE (transglycosylase-associated protein family)
MGIFSWILFGLLAGAIARLVVPGSQKIGCLATIAVGILGALIGGALMQAVDRRELDDFSIRTVLVAAVGAVLLLLVLQALAGRGPRTPRR